MINTSALLAISVLLFIIGVSGGWGLSKLSGKEAKAQLRLVVGLVVCAMWVISVAAEIIISAYTVSVLVHGIMGAVVGYLFSDDGININIGRHE